MKCGSFRAKICNISIVSQMIPNLCSSLSYTTRVGRWPYDKPDSQPAVLSPILQARERLKQDAYMKKRLKNVTCSVDNSCPKAYASGWHKRPNRKKLALERDRKMLVEQDNRLLLQRISDIMQVRSQQTVSPVAISYCFERVKTSITHAVSLRILS